MSVESLKRPPTLLTIPSSFNSSNILTPFELSLDNATKFIYRPVQVFVDHLIIVIMRVFEFALCGGNSPLERFFRLGAASPKPLFVGPQRLGAHENRYCL